jgi:transcriptional regulator with XRE-family HTH domain
LSQSALHAKLSPAARKYRRGSGTPDPIDVHVGARIRRRRLLLRMSGHTLAQRIGFTFQQVQKYETGVNRVSASRLWVIAEVLGVPIGYFFDDLEANMGAMSVDEQQQPSELLQQPETTALVRLYYAITDMRVREQVLALLKAVGR